MIPSSVDAKKILSQAIKASRADEAQVSLSGSVEGNLRWAVNQVTTSGEVEKVSLSVTSAFGRRHASANTDRLDAASVEATVRRSEEMARLMPENPEWMPVLGPQKYASVDAHKDGTAGFDPAKRAAAVKKAIDVVEDAALKGAGFLKLAEGMYATMSSRGLYAYHRDTDSQYTTTVRTPDGTGSGWAGGRDADATRLDVAAMTDWAIKKAQESVSPRELKPGRYPVILEAPAVGSLLQQMMWALSRRSADEGRSAFSKEEGETKVGEKLFADSVTLYSDPTDPAILSAPFTGGGLPLGKETWVDAGVLKKLHVGRYWADKKKIAPTPFPSGFRMLGGGKSLEDLIAGADGAVLVTRLWYIRWLDARTLTVTGLTRDGTFWVEKGKIAYPVKNFRFNDSPLSVLSKVEAIGEPVLLPSGWGGTAVLAPPIRVSELNFASLSDAV